MKLLKPSWVHHDEKPIFSVDVHQECLKFATGGQGMDSGRVVIWNLLPVLSEKAEQDDSVPKMLCQMDNHLACVNCVRWSQNGHMLASGSDDKLVMVWRKAMGPSGVFGTGGIQKNPESWKCVATLRGHAGDVLDLAWSPQDSWLASCSIDNTIIVWDAHGFPNMLAMLKGHTGLVKGVAWDPVGKFLASQSDDRSVKIWKTSDWTCSSTITEPFDECGGTTHILRLSWSPDGQYLVSAHAMNGGGPTAQIIEREGWKCDKDFVGHRKAVTCVRFHNSILKRQAPKTNKPQQYCCLAVGSRDRSLSVWMTALQRPLVVIHELFKDSILDLSWGPKKCILMACSGDGTVACLQFSENELGTPLSEEDKNSLYQRIYGKSATISNGTNGADLLIENPELLNMTQEKIAPPNLLAQTNHNNNLIQTATLPSNGLQSTSKPLDSQPQLLGASAGSATQMKAISKQTEVRTADGKRRITPVFIPLNQDVSAPAPQLNSSSRPMTTASSGTAGPPTTSATDVPGATNASEPKPVISEDQEIRLDSRLTMLTPEELKSRPPPALPHMEDLDRFASSITNLRNKQNSSVSTAPPNVSTGTPYQASTSGPKMNITPTTKCEFYKAALDYRVRVQNGHTQTSTGMLCKVTAWSLSLGQTLWETYVGSPVVNFNISPKYAILCSLDGSLRIFNMQTGTAELPVICLTSTSVQCAFCPHGKYVGVITECGLLRIWDVEKATAILATGCTEVLGKFGPVLQFNITEQGVPFVLFGNGNSYMYSPKLQSWLILNTKDPIFRHGLQTTMPKDFNKNFHAYPLVSVQASINNYAPICSVLDLEANEWQAAAKIFFIENQIKLCEVAHSELELKHWYLMLVFQLAANGDEKGLRLVLDDLLGPAHAFTTREELEERKILSISKLELFECALNTLKTLPKWQRLYMEYQELHKNIGNGNRSPEIESEMIEPNMEEA